MVQNSCPATCGVCEQGSFFPCYPTQCGPYAVWSNKSSETGMVDTNYLFDTGIDAARKEVFVKAVQFWQSASCLRFHEVKSADERPFIKVGVYDSKTCWAEAGYPYWNNDFSRINLGWCNSEAHLFNVVHEIGHSMGMNHEHSRPDASSALLTCRLRNDADASVRWAAAEALGRAGPSVAVGQPSSRGKASAAPAKVLTSRLTDQSRPVRWEASDALARAYGSDTCNQATLLDPSVFEYWKAVPPMRVKLRSDGIWR